MLCMVKPCSTESAKYFQLCRKRVGLGLPVSMLACCENKILLFIKLMEVNIGVKLCSGSYPHCAAHKCDPLPRNES